eukprot:6636213-Prymnesium_polylepis.1
MAPIAAHGVRITRGWGHADPRQAHQAHPRNVSAPFTLPFEPEGTAAWRAAGAAEPEPRGFIELPGGDVC